MEVEIGSDFHERPSWLPKTYSWEGRLWNASGRISKLIFPVEPTTEEKKKMIEDWAIRRKLLKRENGKLYAMPYKPTPFPKWWPIGWAMDQEGWDDPVHLELQRLRVMAHLEEHKNGPFKAFIARQLTIASPAK